MADSIIDQTPTPGAPATGAMLAFWPPAPSTEDSDTHVFEAALKAVLAGREKDFYGDFQATTAFLDANTVERAGAWCIATNSAGAPSAADSANLSEIGDGDYTLILAQRMRSNSDGNVVEYADAFAVADFPVGRVIYTRPQDPFNPNDYLKMTVTAAAVLVGQGNAAYLYMPVTIDEVGDVTDDSDWYGFSEQVPPDIAVDQAVIVGLVALLARLKATGAPWEAAVAAGLLAFLGSADPLTADAIRKAIQGINETVTLAPLFTMKASAAADYQVSDYGTPGGGINIVIPTTDVDDIAHFDRVIHTTTWIDLGTYRVTPVGNISKSTFSGRVTYVFDRAVISGAAPANDSTFYITLEGADVHRGELVRQAFRDWAQNLGGGGGSAGKAWGWNTSATDAMWRRLLDILKADADTDAKKAEYRAALGGAPVAPIVSSQMSLSKNWKNLDLGEGREYGDYDIIAVTLEETGQNRNDTATAWFSCRALAALGANAVTNETWYANGRRPLIQPMTGDIAGGKCILGKAANERYPRLAVDVDATNFNVTVELMKIGG